MSEAGYEQSSSVNQILSDVLKRSGALTALMVTKEGVSVSEAGDTTYLNTTAMAALLAGMFSATREVARMVGEKQFSILLQQGETRNIHISLIRESRMMVVIFDDFQRIGLVRHEARRAGEELEKLLAIEVAASKAAEKIATPEFKEYALNIIDRIFETK